MPDPAKSVGDIDDVLSSIRRLVAEQPVPARPDTNRRPDPAPRPGGEDRLVLTPALRVTDPDGPARAGMPNARDGDDMAGPEELAETKPESAEIAPEHPDSASETTVSDTLEEDAETSMEGTQTETAQESELSMATMTETLEGQGGDSSASEQVEVEAPARDDRDAPTEMPSAFGSESAEALDASTEEPSASVDDPPQPAFDDTAPETLTNAPANDAGRPEARDDGPDPRHEGAEDGHLAQDDATVSDGAGPTDEAHVIGDDGWRPEMRLFDWDASAQTGDAAPEGLPTGAEQFESETGDANWPDETADRAVLDLAAVRETAVTDTNGDAGTRDGRSTEGTVTGFTPIFSRRVAGPGLRDASQAGVPPSTPEDRALPTESQPAAAEAPPGGDLTEMPAAETAETASMHAIAPEEPDAEGTAIDGGDMEPGMTDADAVAFSSVRDIGKEDPAAEATAPDPEATDTTPLADDLPSFAATQDEGERTGSGARLTVLVGKGAPDTAGAGASPDAEDAVAPGGNDLRSVDTRILEEEVLRRIVAEAVRDELQGALGERITRNVRKLVRREIRLVLAADELD